MTTVLLPRSYVCPLSMDIMDDPWMDSDGNSYEREWILNYLAIKQISPISRNYLTVNMLRPNLALKDLIQEFKMQHPDSVKMFQERRITTDSLVGLQTNTTIVTTTHVSPSYVYDQSSFSDIVIQAESFYTDNYSVLKLLPQSTPRRMPVNIAFVVDISGSMGEEIKFLSDEGLTQQHGFSRLDMVKHALYTIIKSLRDGDSISLITFSDDAQTVFSAIEINTVNKTMAENSIKRLTPDANTNIWAGIKQGLSVLSPSQGNGKVNSLFLFTDGVPNVNPIRGYDREFDSYIHNFGNFNCTINAFGFGYSIDSELLQKFAKFGNGTYAFIPDGTFVGTIFINALANTFRTIATNASCKIMYENGIVQIAKLDNILFEQNRTVIVPRISNGENLVKPIKMEFKYFDIVASSEIIFTNTCYLTESSPDIEEHVVRTNFANVLMNCLDIKNISELMSFISKLKVSHNQSQFITDILKDAEGQAMEAFSFTPITDKHGTMCSPFDKWGRRFIPSLAEAHRTQQCNNFKDPGVQHYTGELFESLRDELNDIFNSLPPPMASITHTNTRNTNIYAMPRAPVNMSAYNNSSGGCFNGQCLVLMSDDSLKLVKDVRVGDNIMLSNKSHTKVTHMTKIKCDNNKINLTKIGDLLITPWHPILLDGIWQFPYSIGITQSHECEYVYNFVLDIGHIVTVNGIKCVTLGHGFTDNDVVSHEYFGTHKVIDDLSILPIDSNGMIVINEVIRNKENRLICKFI